jgi:CxxC-x17-CxxC domain-containing protein
MTEDEITIFGETTFRNRFRRFGIKMDDRRRHMYFIGKTGMGKSTILENMIVEDIRAGKGVAVVDPHGDLAEKIIDYIPSGRVNDMIYFNPADIDYPIAFNVVEHVEPHLRHLVASGLIGVFQKLWADSWGPRLEYILRNAILAVLDYPGSTLLAVTRMLSDKAFRKKVVEKIQDPVVKSFWVNEFAGYANNFASEAVSPIQNKVGQFLSSSLIRNIVGQVKSTIDLRKVMDEGKILIMNLSKGRIGEDNSALLGSMMITKIQLAAMSRVEIPEPERRDFYLYVDEFQNFATESFANILSEARKYRLNLVLAHQYIEQLNETVQAAVFGNVGTLVVFRVGAADAEILEPEFMPVFTKEDIVNLPKYEIYLKLMIDGIASEPFSARGLPPLYGSEITGNRDKAIKISRERYAKERKTVEEKIMRWHESIEETDKGDTKFRSKGKGPLPARKPPERETAALPARPEARAAETGPKSVFGEAPAAARSEAPAADSIYRFETVCFRCGQPARTSFKPDGIRPVYCRDCLSVAKQEKIAELEARKQAKKAELARLAGMAEPPAREAAPEISLSEAFRQAPVKFKTPAQTAPGDNNRQSPPGEKPASSPGSAPPPPQSELKEGEEISFG